jgi:PhnB protein
VKFTIEVEEVDYFFTRAIEKGCTELRAVENQFYGYRGGMIADPFGYSWFVQEKIEDLSEAEMQVRWDKVFEG